MKKITFSRFSEDFIKIYAEHQIKPIALGLNATIHIALVTKQKSWFTCEGWVKNALILIIVKKTDDFKDELTEMMANLVLSWMIQLL